MVVGARCDEYLTNGCSIWDFHAQTYLGFTKNGPKNKIKIYNVSGKRVSKTVLLKLEDNKQTGL